jgi:hypothetical protein
MMPRPWVLICQQITDEVISVFNPPTTAAAAAEVAQAQHASAHVLHHRATACLSDTPPVEDEPINGRQEFFSGLKRMWL